MSISLGNRVKVATKWSTFAEIIAKLISPVVNMVLARLLTPEAFGIVATLTMIISFAEIFTDAGFQKYLVQHQFKDDTDRIQSSNVAFWSNLVMSLFIWGIIAALNEPLARLVGNPGLGHVLIVACVSIPLVAFSSIQAALYKRDLDFKTLFKVRAASVCVPLFVTIPLAFWLRSFWALVIGTIARNIVDAILLTVYSRWKPSFSYSFAKLKEMLSFTVWSMIEAISIWLTGYVDVFIVGTVLNQYYLGLYKTSSATAGAIMGLVVAATTPILFSALSRLQDDENEFRNLFFRFQKLVGIVVIPLGFGIFCFRDLTTRILLGNQWLEASGFIGLWGLTSSPMIVLSNYASEVYRAKGRPKWSVLAQFLHIIFLWPAVLVSVKYGFKVLCITRSIVRLQAILVDAVLLYLLVRIRLVTMLKNITPSVIAALIMSGCALVMLYFWHSVPMQLLAVLICGVTYCLAILCFPKERAVALNFIRRRSKNK